MKRPAPNWLRFFPVLGVILLPCSLFALDPAKSVYQFNCKSWTREDGLPSSGINAITQTKDGFLWLGTQKGLVRFDGVEFKSFPLPHQATFRTQIISALSSSRGDGLWFGIRNGSFGFYSEASGFSSPQGESWISPTMNVLSICEAHDGAVWVGGESGIGRWVKEAPGKGSYDALTAGLALHESARGRIWLGTVDRGLFYWENGKLTAFPDPTLARDSVDAVTEDPLGQIWVGTKIGLRCYGADFQRKAIPPIYAEVKALLVDSKGALWIGTTGMGLATYKNGAFTFLQKEDGLSHENVTALFEDREGTLWIGTRNGLTQLTDVKLSIYSVRDGILGGGCHAVWPATGGGVWVTTASGLTRLDGTNIQNFTQECGFTSGYLKQALEARDGDIYLINGNKDIEVLSNGKVVARYANTNWPTAFAEDDQSVLVTIGGDLMRVSRTRLWPYQGADSESLPAYWFRSMHTCRDGSILLASVNGLFRLRSDRAVEHWTTQDGLPDNDVLWAFDDVDGTIWAGLTTGIARIRGKHIRPISMKDGLYDNFVYSIVPDDQGSFWVNSTRGIFRVRRSDLDAFADQRAGRVECAAFDNQEAAKVIDTTEIEYSGCKSLDGRIWFPSPQGPVMIDPTNLFSNPIAPPVKIEGIRVNGRDWQLRKSFAVRPGRGDVELHYTAASFIAPQRVQFRYRLEGYEPEWVDAGSRRSAFYTNLKPGKYCFRVEACNADGVWNTAGDSIGFELLPHFYQTLWFETSCLALGAAALAAIYAWRMRHLRRRHWKLQKANEILESKVRERTRELLDVSRQAGMAEIATNVLHNVGNVLNSVNVSATLIEEKVQNSGAESLKRAIALLQEQQADVPASIDGSSKGKKLVEFFSKFADHLSSNNAGVREELTQLVDHIEHIKKIVAMQQTYARVAGVTEAVAGSDLVEDALRMSALEQRGIALVREYTPVPQIKVDRHKAIQILVNLLQNAAQACEAAKLSRPQVVVRISPAGHGCVAIQITDNGVGIPKEHLTKVFSHGFTTWKNGHGYALHSGALAAKEMGGVLLARSEGPGKGATFVLELPAGTKEPGKNPARDRTAGATAPAAHSSPAAGRETASASRDNSPRA